MELIKKTRRPSWHLLGFALLSLLIFLAFGCASARKSQDLTDMDRQIASVNGEPVTLGDMGYVLELVHRKESLPETEAFQVQDFIQKLINDMLIIQEARSMGLENDGRVVKSTQLFVINESVRKLYKEEVQDKVKITDEDLLEYYTDTYELFTIGLIETPSEEEANKAMEELKAGNDFMKTAEKYTDRRDKGEGGDYKGDIITTLTLSKKALSQSPAVLEKLDLLKADEVTGIIKEKNGKFYIVKFLSRSDPEKTDLEHIRKKLEGTLRKVKEEQRGEQYIALLREKADIEIDKDTLATIDIKNEKNNEQFLEDKRKLARVNDKVLTVGEYVDMLAKAKPGANKAEFVNEWISIQLVNQDALTRHYDEKDPELKSRIKSYKDQLLRNAFIEREIIPKISISEEMLKDYYSRNKEKFGKPDAFRYQQITVRDMETAQKILDQLKAGADFSWLATENSIDFAREFGGKAPLTIRTDLPQEEAAALEKLQQGQMTPLLKVPSGYKMMKLLEFRKGEVPPLETIRALVQQGCFMEEMNKALDSYATKLKENARISMDQALIQDLQSKLEGANGKTEKVDKK